MLLRDSSYRLVDGEGAVVLQSPLLELPGLVHGFATRRGGVSQGTFQSLNFGLKGGDRPEHVRANLDRLGRRVGFAPERCYRLSQVHGREVVVIAGDEDPAAVLRTPADALVTDRAGVTLGVATADCVPVLLVDPVRRAAGAAHAGWRGLAGGVLEATIATLADRFGAVPSRLLAAIGPCIGPCCYEVGEEVASALATTPAALLRGDGPRPHLDLPAAARARLVAAGLAEASISAAGLCTRCHDDLLFSYRRDRELSGHHLSVVGLVSP